jgi:thermopsin
MRFILIATAVFLILNITFASQLLNKGYFLYNNVTVAAGQYIVIGVNTSSNVDVVVMPSSYFSSYVDGGDISAVYNKTVSSGVFKLGLGAGRYTVVSEALGTTKLDVGVVAVSGGGRLINLNGKYVYNFSLANYSNVHISLLSSADYSNDPIVANLSGISTNISADANLDTLNLSVNKGEHRLLLTSRKGMQLFIAINATPELVNPLLQITPGNNYSIGVASYGLYNISGKLYPYQVLTDEVVGVANITALSAYNPAPPPNSSINGASLQLNVGLNTHVNSKLVVFWLQDVIDFNTSSDRYYFVDNIWNNTNPSANLTTGTVVGVGNLSFCSSCGNQTFYVDSYPVYYLNYSFPFSVKLVILENQTPRGSMIDFGYQVLRNGTSGVTPLFFFDRVLIPGADNTTLVTTPYYQTPGKGEYFGNYYDTELVFGGEADGANTRFQQLNSSLWLYYNDNGTLMPFPSVYIFGLSTEESASGIGVRNWSGGALATLGTPNFSTDIFAGNSLARIAQYISNTSNYTSPVTTVGVIVNQFQVNSISPVEIGAFELVAAVAVVFILVVGFLLLRRR